MKKEKKDIFILQTCDEWKSHSSMSICMVTTNFDDMARQIKEMIKAGDMLYGADNTEESVDCFYHDWNYFNKSGYNQRVSASKINNLLEYGFIEVWEDGEINY